MQTKWYFSRDLEGIEYINFFKEFYRDWSEFQFFIRSDLEHLSSEGRVFLDSIKKCVTKHAVVKSYHANEGDLANGVTAEAFVVKINDDSVRALVSSSNSLFGWVQPLLPEDIQILDLSGNVWLRAVTHEGFVEISPTEKQLQVFQRDFPGLLVNHEEYLQNPPLSYYAKLYGEED